MLTFKFQRDRDVSGVSGLGEVAEGVRFADGSCALHWKSELSSTTVFASVEDVRRIHGHNGATKLVWDHVISGENAKKDSFIWGQLVCLMDYTENSPFVSIGGLNMRATADRPIWPITSETERGEFMEGYRDMAFQLFGEDWRTCGFGWKPTMSLDPEATPRYSRVDSGDAPQPTGVPDHECG